MATKVTRYNSNRTRREIRVRSGIKGSERPRLTVFRSNKFMYAQVIDDTKGQTLAHAKGKNPAETGADVAKKSIKKGVKEVVFDRGSYKYHGKVKALAEAARKEGLNF